MPRQTQVRTHRSTAQRIDSTKLQEVFFSNEFPLSDPARAYMGIKAAIQFDNTCTRVGIGRHEFPTEIHVPAEPASEPSPQKAQDASNGTPTRSDVPPAISPAPTMVLAPNPIVRHFRRLIQFYENKDDLEIRRLIVHETGLTGKGTNAVYDFGPVADDMLRIVVNLYPPVAVDDSESQKTLAERRAASTMTGIRVNISSASAWLTMRRAYGVVLVSGLTNISIMPGQNIPGTRHENSHSLFVIMDVKGLGDTRLNVANRLCAQDPSKSAALIEQISQLAAEANKGKPEEADDTDASPDKAADAEVGEPVKAE